MADLFNFPEKETGPLDGPAIELANLYLTLKREIAEGSPDDMHLELLGAIFMRAAKLNEAAGDDPPEHVAGVLFVVEQLAKGFTS